MLKAHKWSKVGVSTITFTITEEKISDGADAWWLAPCIIIHCM